MKPAIHRRAKVSLMPLVHRPKYHWWRRWGRWVALSLGSLLLITGLFSAYYYPKAKTALTSGQAAMALAKRIPNDISQQQFAKAKTDVAELQAKLGTTATAIHRMQGLRLWPYVGRQYRAVEDLLQVGDDSADAVSSLVDFAAHVFAPFADRGKVSLASISAEDKGKLLAGMSEQEDSLKSAQQAIQRAAVSLNRIPEHGLITPLRTIIDPLKKQFPQVEEALQKAIPATHLLPSLLGYPDQKTYLFLMENNAELRPGGGFIGTYGLMKLSSGEIVSLVTDNSYNLDAAAKNLTPITPPEPISTYLKVHAWYFRDANWSPDFPSSAQQSLVLYKREGGQKHLDGVIAVTPTAITALLKLVGPITVSGIEFTPENFYEKLQSYVDRGFQYSGVDESQRKDIIGPLTKELVDRLLKLPLSKWGDLFLVLGQSLDQKQLLFYIEDSALQSIVQDLHWGGSMASSENSNYLMIADANLASLKTDPVMQRTYTYSVQKTTQGLEGHLKVDYHNAGKFDWKTTRYNTYLRVYLPAGAKLLSSDGAQVREKSNRAGKITTSSELGKTVFGAFKSIEPGTSSSIEFSFLLPPSLTETLKAGQTTKLIWEKQPGMVKPTINLTYHIDGLRPTNVAGLDNQARLSKDGFSFSGDLDHDRTVTITY